VQFCFLIFFPLETLRTRLGKVFTKREEQHINNCTLAYFFCKIFFPNIDNHTTGIYCNVSHPVFSIFPNEGHNGKMITGIQAMAMDDFPAGFPPLVHLIDDWFTNRKLGILFETKIGEGKLMVCSADIANDWDKRITARQFRRSIEQYVASEKFNPDTEIDINLIKHF